LSNLTDCLLTPLPKTKDTVIYSPPAAPSGG